MTTAAAARGHAEPGIDLSQFHEVFYEEAAENLAGMESLLLAIDGGQPGDEDLNAIFRCAHSIKGGAATFGFDEVAALTHVLETLLDRLRRHELAFAPAMVDALLESGDALRAQLACRQAGGGDAPATDALVVRLRALADGRADAVDAPGGPVPSPARAPAMPALGEGERLLELRVGPLARGDDAGAIVALFDEIPGLGRVVPRPVPADDPAGIVRFVVATAATDADLVDLLGFHVAREQVAILPVAASVPNAAIAGAASPDDAGFGFFGEPVPAAVPPAAPAPAAADLPAVRSAGVAPPARAPEPRAAAEASTLRVAVEKVDSLVNLVGELVITQSMLAQTARGLDPVEHRTMMAGLADLERNTRLLQESVMAIRMIPMSVVFNRFPRMLRDLAGRLGKRVELHTVGDDTELDKGLIEKITDPLTHLVRNAADHGIEPPAERLRAGKPEHGTITLSAVHQGGSVVIEVRDDGRGLQRDRILRKARERGLPVHDAMPDDEVWQLVMAPGFSTAESITDVSGRGVGMDVVLRNISALGGKVELESTAGLGTRVSVRLPLTLAIMDGMSVGVGDETYIVPLGSVVESIRVQPGDLRRIGGDGVLIAVRDAWLPVLALDAVYGVPRATRDAPTIAVLVECEGAQVALLVDELLGQHQVVVKNLEANYRRVPGVSGATILGDGRVSLILDVEHLVRRARPGSRA